MSESAKSDRIANEERLVQKGLLARPPQGVTPMKFGGRWLDMLTISLFEQLPDGTEVVSIFGVTYTKGVDYIDLDTRAGCIAFGLPVSDARARELTERYGEDGLG